MNQGLLSGVRVKIDRAKQHFKDLEAEISAFLSSHPYTLVVQLEATSGEHVYRVSVNAEIPTHWGATIGDITHNLRSALDHLAVALVIQNGKSSKTAIRETYFPIGASKETFSTGKIKRAAPKAIRLIERLKPYKGGTDLFYRLHQFDILDKHYLLVPVGAAHTQVGMTLRMPGFDDGEEIAFPPIFFAPQNRQFPLKHGAQVFRYRAGDGPTPKDGDVQCAFTISFGDGQVFDGEPVIPSLKQLVDFTERAIDIFARHIFKCEW